MTEYLKLFKYEHCRTKKICKGKLTKAKKEPLEVFFVVVSNLFNEKTYSRYGRGLFQDRAYHRLPMWLNISSEQKRKKNFHKLDLS